MSASPGKTIAIIGVSGYIGRELMAFLARQDSVDRIVGIDLRQPKTSPAKLAFYPHDVSHPFADIFSENHVDAAIHLAFRLQPGHAHTEARRTDVTGTVNFLEACREAGVRQLLYFSSHTVYGAHADNPVPLTEESALRPLPGFQYSQEKVETEGLFHQFAESNPGTCVTIVRSGMVVGADPEGAVAASMFRRPMLAVRDYNPPLQFIYVEDLAELTWTLLRLEKPGVYNAAGEGTVHYRELASLAGTRMITVPTSLFRFLMTLSWKLRLQSQSPPSGLGFIQHPIVMSTQKLQKETGFRFRYSSRDAVVSYLKARSSAV